MVYAEQKAAILASLRRSVAGNPRNQKLFSDSPGPDFYPKSWLKLDVNVPIITDVFFSHSETTWG